MPPRAHDMAGVLILLAAGGLALQSQQPRDPVPTLILTRAKVFTSDSTRPWAEAIAIRGDRIVAVGTTAQVSALAGPATRRIDVGGRVIVPGFNDAHLHMGCGGRTVVNVVTSANPTADPPWSLVADSLAAAVRRAPPGTWIAASVGPRVLNDTAARRAALDRLAPRNPVRLHAWTGHGSIFNTAALRTLGISDTIADPLGGRFEREPSSRRLTGLAEEYADDNAGRAVCDATPDSALVRALRANGRELLRAGITSVQDMADNHDPARTVRIFRAAALPQRVRIIAMPGTTPARRLLDGWDAARRSLETSRDTTGRLTVSGIKWILDGTPVEELAAHRRAYIDRPGWFGRLNFPPDTMRAMLDEAVARNQQPILHAVGDSTIVVLLNLMERTGGAAVWRARRLRIEHGDGLAPDLRAQARRLGVIVVQNPTHFDLPELRGHLAPALLANYQPARSLIAQGIPFALGSDGPFNPFLNIMLATIHPNDPKESLTREQAVVAYTRGSAYAEFAEHEKGILAAGMLADLAVLSQDIFTVAPQKLPGTTSVLTIVGGKIVLDER